jgi:outer membrane protein OmpA-like peptidoglycan-associated protein
MFRDFKCFAFDSKAFVANAKAMAQPAALALAFFLGGCASVPTWANPVEWYDGVFGARTPPPASKTATANKPAAGTKDGAKTAESGFPNLENTPDRPKTTSTAERRAVQSGLVADRENAKHTDEVIRGRAPQPNPGAPDAMARAAPPGAPGPAPSPGTGQPPAAAMAAAPVPLVSQSNLAPKPAVTVLFDGNSDKMDGNGQTAIRLLADLHKLQGGKLRVVGYGSEAVEAAAERANTPTVSRQRALAVAAELVRNGVNPQAISVEVAPIAGAPARTAAIFLEN